MKNASSVIIVPGYGMAVAQAQHAEEMVDTLKKMELKSPMHTSCRGKDAGHMNVLLAEQMYHMTKYLN